MDHFNETLWQGGPWEQPSPPFSPPPPVHIPKRSRHSKKARPSSRTSHKRKWVLFSLTLVLIFGLTGLSIALLPEEKPAEPNYHQSNDTHKEPIPVTIPQAETGSGVVVPITAPHGQPLTYPQVYEKNQDSIVTVHTMAKDGLSQGTGIVLTQDGYIITNAHVVEGAMEAVVLLNNDQDYRASLVGLSTEEDLAVLKIEAKDLIPAEFGDSTLLRVGDPVSALGNPLGYRMTMTPGIVSALDRPLDMDGHTMYLLQTSAAINFGNSGGALFNDRGQVVGVTTIKIVAEDGSAEGLGFAIPTQRVKYVVDQLIAGEELRTPMLGVTVRRNPSMGGLDVLEIQPWSDAVAKGLKVGDVILSANGQPTRNNDDLDRIKNMQKVGDTILLEVSREGQRLRLSILLGANN